MVCLVRNVRTQLFPAKITYDKVPWIFSLHTTIYLSKESFVNGQCTTCSSSGCSRMGKWCVSCDLWVKSDSINRSVGLGFHSIDSPGRGNMYLSTRDTAPFCGLFLHCLLSYFFYRWAFDLGYHYVIEIELDRNMTRINGEIFVSIHSNYEMLKNISMTSKFVLEFSSSTNLSLLLFFF